VIWKIYIRRVYAWRMYMYTSDASVLPEVEKKNMIECGWEGVERVGRACGVRLELFVSEAAANLSKNMFDPFSPQGVNRPSTLCCGGTAQTVNRIFIILQRWHFPVIFSFYDHFSSLALIRRLYCSVYIILLSPYSAEKTHTAFLLVPATLRAHTHIHTQKPLGFIFNLQNDVEIESAVTGSAAQWLFSVYTKSFFLSSLLCISDVWPYCHPVPVSILFIFIGIHTS
jgi:hypothetical protein